MPSVRYRVTFALQTGGIGASETYISPQVEVGSAAGIIDALIRSRNTMLFTITTWRSVRIGLYGERRRSTPYPPGTYRPFAAAATITVPGTGLVTTTPIAARPDQARSCLQVRVRFDSDRSTLRYLSFVPDGILYDEAKGVDFSQAPAGWSAAYANFQDRLINDGWGLKAQQKSGGFAPKTIANWVTSAAAPNLMGFVLPALPAPGIAVTEEVQVSGVKRKGTDRTSYNGKYVVQAINETTLPGSLIYYLRNTEAGDPASIRKMGTVNRIAYDVFGFQQLTSIRPGVHKRGKPQGVPSGRRQSRASL